MAPHGNPSVQNWYLSDSCPLISIAEQAWDFRVLFNLFQVIEMWGTLAGWQRRRELHTVFTVLITQDDLSFPYFFFFSFLFSLMSL